MGRKKDGLGILINKFIQAGLMAQLEFFNLQQKRDEKN